MWPFRPKSASANEHELAESALLALVRDLEQRVRILEREHEDLHTRYRRLRAAQAAEAMHSQPADDRAQQGDPGEPAVVHSTKEELRRRHLKKAWKNPRGADEPTQ